MTIKKLALEAEINFYYPDENTVSISTDEITTFNEINTIIGIFCKSCRKRVLKSLISFATANVLKRKFLRKSDF